MRKKKIPLPLVKVVFQAVLFLLSISLFSGVYAQTSTVGNISGEVRDPSGAALPRVEVVITEERTGVVRTVKTQEDGRYSALSLPIGLYTISTAPQGFKKTVSSGQELHVNENLTINLTLELGQMSETVTVTAEGLQVETRSGDVSSLIGEKQVTELPLNGRNYAQLALMVPGKPPAGNFAAQGTGLD